MPEGVILKGIGGFYYVKSEGNIFECKVRGIFRKNNFKPLPGDYVRIEIEDYEKLIANIEEIHERKNELIRPNISNIDQLAIVISVNSPVPDDMLIVKILATCEKLRIRPIIIINKIDLDYEGASNYTNNFINTNYEVVRISAKNNVDKFKLEHLLKGKITAFAGQSGVGKSTILNLLQGEEVMEIGKISKKISRGKHTTRHSELIEYKIDGYIVDTPGFSTLELADILYDELKDFFPDFGEHNFECKYRGCMHIQEPDCMIKKLLDKGDISKMRYDSYVKIVTYLKEEEKFKY